MLYSFLIHLQNILFIHYDYGLLFCLATVISKLLYAYFVVINRPAFWIHHSFY